MAVAVKRKLIHKFLFSILTVIIVGMGGLTFFSYSMSRDALQGALEGQVTQVADSTVDSMSSWVKDRRLDIGNWSQQKVYQSAVQDSFLGKAARKGANDELTRLKNEYGYYADLLLINKAGDLVAGSVADLTAVDSLAGADYFKQAIAGAFYVSQVFKDTASGRAVFAIAVPVAKAGAAAAEGVLAGLIDLKTFNRIFVDSVKMGESGYSYMFDSSGLICTGHSGSGILWLKTALNTGHSGGVEALNR